MNESEASISQPFEFNPEAGTIDSIAKLLEEVNNFRGPYGGALYLRGHENHNWGLRPTIGREHFFVGRSKAFDAEVERAILHRFRRRAYAHIHRTLGEWEALLLGRHHGLPVRLLDWTSNTLAALYFASAYNHPSECIDGAIWALIRRPSTMLQFLDIFKEETPPPLQVKGIRIIYPAYVSPRLTAQESIFTIQEDPWSDLEQYSARIENPSDNDIRKLAKWKVPGKKKAEIVEGLERLGISRKSLFPDLDGIGLGLWHTEVIRGSEYED